ncbi:MAG: hypothetical protein NDJ92_12125 [Thermoanaerobaculia bacterium]|nr:hypothetical protein [Thermoanaerobaculia bacterium]
MGKPRLLLRPGAPGTKRFAEKYGDALVAVRYRYDEKSLRRYTTVELVVEESKWIPERCISDPDRQVGLRIGYEETALRARIRGVQARWDPVAKLWWMTLAQATQLNLEERIAAWGATRTNISADR